MTGPDADRRPRDAADDALFGDSAARGAARPEVGRGASLQPDRPPPPPPSSRKKRKAGVLSVVSGFLTFILVGLFAGGFGVMQASRKLREPGPLAADKVVYIAPGTDVPEIVSLLETEGVIDNSLLFNVALVAEGARSKLKAGEYQFKQSASLQDVMDTLVSGRQILHSVTLPEGLTSEQIVQRLRESDLLTGDIREIPKEGTLLPETYRVQRGMSRNDLIRKMQEDQRKLVDQIWARRIADLPVATPYQLVTLASIVEKETGKADERPRVAGVFINRLNKRMRLQSDPTIVYGLVQGRGTLGRGILRSEVDKWTPYNTYQIDGLPPGPIANPGRAALEAVANPSRTADLYFVADGTGGHVFADTLDAHARNVARWRQIEKDARERAAGEVDRAPIVGPPAPGPVAPAPKPGGQRTEAAPDAFGALPRLAEAAADSSAAWRASLAPSAPEAGRLRARLFGDDGPRTIVSIVEERQRPRPTATTTVVAMTPPAAPTAPVTPPAPGEKPQMALSFGPDVEALGLQVRGVQTRSNLLDGPASPDGDGGDVSLATYPVSPQRRAEQKAAAARLGLAPVSDALPPDEASAPPATAVAAVQRHARAFDASEGTPLDPLRNKNWDLNHAQVIPPPLSR